MQYALIISEGPGDFARREGPDAPAYWGAWTAYSRSVAEAGIMRGGAGLQPPATATTLRHVNGKPVVQDGPFIDSKEQLGGFFIIEVAHLDEAIKWASRIPISASGRVEIRPVLPPPPATAR